MAKARSAPRRNRIISWRAIREFIDAHPEDPSAEEAFAKWYDLVRNNRFANFNDVRRTFPRPIWLAISSSSTFAVTDTGSSPDFSMRKVACTSGVS